MGQYHYLVNLDKHEFVHPHQVGDGLKLVEQLYAPRGGICSALHILVAASNGCGGGDFPEQPSDEEKVIGRWAGDRIAIVGDYAEDTDLPAEFRASMIYDLCGAEDDPELLEEARFQGLTPYCNITEFVVPVLQRLCTVIITGDGWRDRTLVGERDE